MLWSLATIVAVATKSSSGGSILSSSGSGGSSAAAAAPRPPPAMAKMATIAPIGARWHPLKTGGKANRWKSDDATSDRHGVLRDD
eukprot:SAG11_NODE_14763_length_600_cov_1.508982_1_plen_84_part_10